MNLETAGKRLLLLLVVFFWNVTSATEKDEKQFHSENNGLKNMLLAIENTTRMTMSYTGVKAISDDVMDAMTKVDRARFVPEYAVKEAFENYPLSIGHGQTISQPFIVALMTHFLQVQPDDRVLEIGTGSGYQAAVLAELANQVFTVEIIKELASSADRLLKSLGYTNISVKASDGWYGWPQEAPFDGILVTAVASKIPPKLLDQLAVGGRLVMPVGNARGNQELVVITREETGAFTSKEVLPVRFVPMTGQGVLTLRNQ